MHVSHLATARRLLLLAFIVLALNAGLVLIVHAQDGPRDTHRLFLPLILKQPAPPLDCNTPPRLIAPPDGSRPTTSRPTFERNYGDNPGARVGRYEFSWTDTFQQLYYWGQQPYPAGTTDHSVFSQPQTTFFYGTTYYWRATLQCADGRWLYSPVWSFTPLAPG